VVSVADRPIAEAASATLLAVRATLDRTRVGCADGLAVTRPDRDRQLEQPARPVVERARASHLIEAVPGGEELIAAAGWHAAILACVESGGQASNRVGTGVRSSDG
jgi:hypothetical protein